MSLQLHRKIDFQALPPILAVSTAFILLRLDVISESLALLVLSSEDVCCDVHIQ